MTRRGLSAAQRRRSGEHASLSAVAVAATVTALAANLGCGGQDRRPAFAPPVAADPVAPAPETSEARLFRLLTGRFDSSTQAAKDPGFHPVQLVTCEVEAPTLGARVLYVEQAMMATPDKPYRQRLYVVEAASGTPDQVVSRVFELADPAAKVGWCDKPAPRTIEPFATTEKVGCAVTLTLKGDRFVGGTVAKGCASALRGASYTTSEVSVGEGDLTSWDRGYDAGDTQVWGAKDGPYVFDRRRASDHRM
jgi:hypothetical protein